MEESRTQDPTKIPPQLFDGEFNCRRRAGRIFGKLVNQYTNIKEYCLGIEYGLEKIYLYDLVYNFPNHIELHLQDTFLKIFLKSYPYKYNQAYFQKMIIILSLRILNFLFERIWQIYRQKLKEYNFVPGCSSNFFFQVFKHLNLYLRSTIKKFT